MITAAEREQLLRKAQIVANETETAANDANRIGTLFALIVRALGDGATEEDIKDLIRNFGSGLFLSKLNEDTASAVITFLQGLKIGNWQEGDLIGSGGYIDPDANATLNSLRLREWLEVPELRYNRVEIFLGTQWHSFGGGIIATVDGNGTSGSATLKLEDGEVGAVAADDLCMGIWHDTSGNATTDSDDRQGRFSFRGFKTVYFRITSVPATDAEGADNSDRHYFEYALRSIAEGGNGFHPFAGMHFSGRGNPTDTNRQAFQYSTLEYSLRLKGVTTWEFQPSNIVNIEGKLDGFSMPARRRNPITGQEETYLKPFSGYGQVFGNAYMFGTIDQFERVADVLEIVQSTDGRLVPGETGTVTLIVRNAYGEDITQQYTNFAVTRDSGNNNGDAAWNALHTSVANPFTLSFDDLGAGAMLVERVLFSVTATKNDNSTVQGSFVVSADDQARLHVEFELSRSLVYVDDVAVVAEARLYYGESDVTDRLLLQNTTGMSWHRDSGVQAEDAAWIGTTGTTRNILLIEHGRGHQRQDCGSRWEKSLTCTFKFKATIQIDYNDTVVVSEQLHVGS